MTIGMTKEQIIDFEIGAFTELIEMINALGLPSKPPKRIKTTKIKQTQKAQSRHKAH
jgi:hypothetical protein